MWRFLLAVGLCLFLFAGMRAAVDAQRAGTFMGSPDDPAIKYSTAGVNNVVADLNRKLEQGTLKFMFDSRSGYLRSALEALELPIDSQLLVFSRVSLQGKRISEQNPRALFFNDRVALGWVRGGDLLEVAAHDETEGVVFYTLDQREDDTTGPPQFKRAFICLGCHVTGNTLGVPGLLMFALTGWLYRASDEYIRLRMLAAAAVSAFVVGAFVFVYGHLELIGFQHLSMAWVHNLGWALFVIQMLRLRYSVK